MSMRVSLIVVAEPDELVASYAAYHALNGGLDAVGIGPGVSPEAMRRDFFARWLEDSGQIFDERCAAMRRAGDSARMLELMHPHLTHEWRAMLSRDTFGAHAQIAADAPAHVRIADYVRQLEAAFRRGYLSRVADAGEIGLRDQRGAGSMIDRASFRPHHGPFDAQP